MMTTPRLVAIDIDGTLLNSAGEVSSRNLRALRMAESAGMEVVIATGRRHSYAMRVLRELDLAVGNALVSSNGTVTRTLGAELLHREHLSTTTARWLCRHIEEFRSTLVLTFDLVGADGDDTRGALVVEAFDDLHANIGRWMTVNEPYIAQVERLEHALDSAPPIQMMLCGTVARMRQAEARLLEHPRVVTASQMVCDIRDGEAPEVTLHRTEYPERDLCILDLLPAGCSKASALQRLSELRGFGRAEVIAIGDNWNDVPMLEFAGQAVLMGNAPADLKALAAERGWRVGPSNDEDGVAVCLEAALAAMSEVPVSA